MKITMVFDGLQIGGIERVGCDYAKLLVELGHDVTVVNLRPDLIEMEKEFPDECKIVHIPFPRKFAPEQYAQLIKRGYWGIIVYPWIFTILTPLNYMYKFFVRLLYKECRRNNDITIAFSGHFNDLTFVSKSFGNNRKKLCWLHGALYSYLLISDGYLNLYKEIRNLIVLVDDAQEEILFYNKKLDLNIHKIYNPTYIADKPINENKVNELRKKYGKFIVMVSRFSYPHKDHYTVAKSIEIIRQYYKENINLLFIGSGPEEDKVKNYVKNLAGDTTNHIFFMGSQMDVQNYYKAAHLLVHASVAGEGLPTIMLEALAYDLPMVVTDSKTGPREILGNDDFGLLCKVQDANDMAKKINRLLNDENLYNHYKKVSKNRLSSFKPEVIKKQLNDVLQEIMK